MEDFSHELVKEGFLMYRDVLSKVHLRDPHTAPVCKYMEIYWKQDVKTQ